MKLKGEIVEVRTIGDLLRIELLTQAICEAEWREQGRTIVTVPNNAAQRKAAYLGRKVKIDIEFV